MRGAVDERIDLGPLSKRGCRELVDALLNRLENVPAALRDLLIGSAEGNPYFVEELVGMLIDDGVIVTGPDQWQVSADKLLEVHVPPTLAGVLQARIDGLPAWGLQFHAEVTGRDLGSWLDDWEGDPDAVATGQDPEQLRAESEARIAAQNDLGRELAGRFLAAAKDW